MQKISFSKKPKIYAYKIIDKQHTGLLKIGQTSNDVEKRVRQQFPSKSPNGVIQYEIVYIESAIKDDGSIFTDHDVHAELKKQNKEKGGEWFDVSIDELKHVVLKIKTNNLDIPIEAKYNFKLRPEQHDAIKKTIAYFKSIEKEKIKPKFLWNAKMRFGKTFTTYKLIQELKYKRALILTFKPAVEKSWEGDLKNHIDFIGWKYYSSKALINLNDVSKDETLICFGSFQDFLQKTKNGGIKPKNQEIHKIKWDIVIFDEYHYGAWRENASNLFDEYDEEKNVDINIDKESIDNNLIDELSLPLTTNSYLFLSGTPFRAINSGEFIEEQIYSWTYTDEQLEKEKWGNNEENPYISLPRITLMTYQIPNDISKIATESEFNEFDLNIFFSTKGKEEGAEFIHEDDVTKWLDLIRGKHSVASIDFLKNSKKPLLPFYSSNLLEVLSHTLWFLPDVNSCFAMKNLLLKKRNSFYHDYKILVCAGKKAGIGSSALKPIEKAMGNDPTKTKTITLTCGKLTTGVTIKPWTGIFMLRNLKSPESYFQAAFRVQSPWTKKDQNNKTIILKKDCYVFDFAINRSLRQIASYSSKLDMSLTSQKEKIENIIKFLPVLAYDGNAWKQFSAIDILDYINTKTTATLLAKKWQSAILVNVDNYTLKRILNTPEALNAIMKIVGFRSLNKDINFIINSSEKIKNSKKQNDLLNDKSIKSISKEQSEMKKKRKEIQDKLIKFATRIPIFMYLTDYREESLKDIITQIETKLFEKVTGLTIKDFELLFNLNLFNSGAMNDAVFQFRRYENASLEYTGINNSTSEKIGGFDTILKKDDFNKYF